MKQGRERSGKRAEDEIDRFLKAQAHRERRKAIVTILIVAALLLGAAAALTRVDYGRLESLARSIKSDTLSGIFPKASQVEAGCDATLPANSSIYVETPFAEYRDDFPRLDIVNGHTYPVVVRITSFDQAVVYQSVSVHAGRSTFLAGIPPGRYGIVTLVGSQWCNMQKGFLDGAVIRAEQLLEMRAGRNERLIFASRGRAPSDMQLTMEEWLPATSAPAVSPASSDHAAAPAPESPADTPPESQQSQIAEPRAGKVLEAPKVAEPEKEVAPVAPEEKPAEVKKKPTRPAGANKSGLSWREQEQERCYDYYAKVRDQIVARMQFSSRPRPGESFREDLRRNELNYQECLSRVSQ